MATVFIVSNLFVYGAEQVGYVKLKVGELHDGAKVMWEALGFDLENPDHRPYILNEYVSGEEATQKAVEGMDGDLYGRLFFRNEDGDIFKVVVHKPSAKKEEAMRQYLDGDVGEDIKKQFKSYEGWSFLSPVGFDELGFDDERFNSVISFLNEDMDSSVEIGSRNLEYFAKLLESLSGLIDKDKSYSDSVKTKDLMLVLPFVEQFLADSEEIRVGLSVRPENDELSVVIKHKAKEGSPEAVFLSQDRVQGKNALSSMSGDDVAAFYYSSYKPEVSLEYWNRLKESNPEFYNTVVGYMQMRIEDSEGNLLRTSNESGVTYFDILKKLEGKCYDVTKVIDSELVKMSFQKVKEGKEESEGNVFEQMWGKVRSFFGVSQEHKKDEQVYVLEDKTERPIMKQEKMRGLFYKGWYISSSSPKGLDYLKGWVDSDPMKTVENSILKEGDYMGLAAYGELNVGAAVKTQTVSDAASSLAGEGFMEKLMARAILEMFSKDAKISFSQQVKADNALETDLSISMDIFRQIGEMVGMYAKVTSV